MSELGQDSPRHLTEKRDRRPRKPPRLSLVARAGQVALNHVSGERTKHRMILVRGAVQTTACPMGLSIFVNTRSHGTATHVLSINAS